MPDRRTEEHAPADDTTSRRVTDVPMIELAETPRTQVWMMSLDGAALACRTPARVYRNGRHRENGG